MANAANGCLLIHIVLAWWRIIMWTAFWTITVLWDPWRKCIQNWGTRLTVCSNLTCFFTIVQFTLGTVTKAHVTVFVTHFSVKRHVRLQTNLNVKCLGHDRVDDNSFSHSSIILYNFWKSLLSLLTGKSTVFLLFGLFWWRFEMNGQLSISPPLWHVYTSSQFCIQIQNTNFVSSPDWHSNANIVTITYIQSGHRAICL